MVVWDMDATRAGAVFTLRNIEYGEKRRWRSTWMREKLQPPGGPSVEDGCPRLNGNVRVDYAMAER
jgi:hypothetical protein